MELRKVSCPKCNYVWECRSLNIYVTCPSCARKIKRNPNIVPDEVKE